MKNTLYLECYSGISGDMTVAALLDLGADETVLDQVLKSIPVTGFETRISRVKKAGLDVCDFAVILDQEHENYDHDMEYLHGQAHSHSHSHSEEHGHIHSYAVGHEHAHNHAIANTQETDNMQHTERQEHTHQHRGLQEILHIIEHSAATDRAKEIAEKIFRILAEAEAKAHGVPIEEVHFHEVGAVDSIVDILAAAVCLDNLDIEQVIVPELYEGHGSIRCQHGVIPVPVPAVVNIAEKHGIPLHMTSTEGELVTPTGAAIVAATVTARQLPEHFTIRKTGLGAGKRDYDRSGILRAMIIEETEKPNISEMLISQNLAADCKNRNAQAAKTAAKDDIYKLETNIDDCSGEQLGFVMEQLLEAGAKDAYYTPVYMKKNRPAYQLNVICTEEIIPQMEELIFHGTTTIGIRRIQLERTILERTNKKVQTRFGEAEVKICTLPNGEKRCYPEYRSVAEIAKKNHMNYQEVYFEIQKSVQINS